MKTLRALLLIVLMAGCSTFRPIIDDTRYFVLSPAPRQEFPGKPIVIGISHIELPEYLRKREIAWRSSNQEIHYAPNLQWGEQIEKMIGRVLSSDMDALFAQDYRRTEVQAEITVSFSHFESDETGKVTIEAAWVIRYSSGNLARGSAKLSSAGPALLKDPAGTAAELSTGLGNLGAQILKIIQSTP